MLKRILGAALAVASPFTFVAAPAIFTTHAARVEARAHTSAYCGSDSYVNSRGRCVHRPMASRTVPQGATAQCRDGTYSFSQSRRGTCSYHGGVARWL